MLDPSHAEFWVLIAFIAFMGIVLYMKIPGQIGKSLDDRADNIRTELDEARRLREEAQALLADYQKKSHLAEEEAKAIIDQARREAEALAEETRKGLTENLARRTKMAEEKIARAEAQALTEVRSSAVDAAIRAAENLLSSKVSGDKGGSLIDASIKDLKGRLN